MLRLVHRHAGDPLQGDQLLLAGVLVLLLKLLEMSLAVGQPLLASRHLRQLRVDLLLLGEDTLLDLDDPRAVLRDLLVDVRAELDSLLTGGDLCLATKRVRLALGLVDEALALLACGTEARLAQSPDGQRSSESPEEEADQNPDDDQHGLAPESVVRGRYRSAHPAVRPAQEVPNRSSEPTPRLEQAVALDPRCQKPFGVGVVGSWHEVQKDECDSENVSMQAKRRMMHLHPTAVQGSFAKSAPRAASTASSPKPLEAR